jgi:hypothetical protein
MSDYGRLYTVTIVNREGALFRIVVSFDMIKVYKNHEPPIVYFDMHLYSALSSGMLIRDGNIVKELNSLLSELENK